MALSIKAECCACRKKIGINRVELPKIENGWLCGGCFTKCFGLDYKNATREMVHEQIKLNEEKKAMKKIPKFCTGCGKPVGFFKTLLPNVDNGWLCQNCYSKCLHVKLENLTPEAVQDILAINNLTKPKENVTPPTYTAKWLYQYCLDNELGIGFNTTWALKHFGVIAKALLPKEKVQATFIGIRKFEGESSSSGFWGCAITDKRFLVAQKKVIGAQCQTISLNTINNISMQEKLVMGTIQIDTASETFVLSCSSLHVNSIFCKIHAVLDDLKRLSQSVVLLSDECDHSSNADEIKKYKELLDIGAITDEEFEVKKKLLLM